MQHVSGRDLTEYSVRSVSNDAASWWRPGLSRAAVVDVGPANVQVRGELMSNDVQQSLTVLTRALDQTAEVLDGVTTDRLADPTPCADWDVADLVAHLIAGPPNFVTMSTGGQPDWSATAELGDNWTTDFHSGADALVEMWRAAGDSAQPSSMDWQTAEFAIHTWDLVQALDLTANLDPEVAQRGLDFMSAALSPDNRGEVFGPEVRIDGDASVYDRLAAFAGRPAK